MPISEMPFRLDLNKAISYEKHKRYSYSQTYDDGNSHQMNRRSYYIRVSAINKEFGEGPYSNIIELRQLDQGKTTRTFCFTNAK